MDSNDPSSAASPPHHHQVHHHHQLLMPPKTLQHHHQQHNIPTTNNNNSYMPLQNNNNNPINANNIMQNPRFPFNPMAAAAAATAAAAAAAPNPMDQHHVADGSSSGFSIEPARKKRGRPRKYSPDNSIGLGLTPAPANNHVGGVGARVDGASSGGGTPSSDTAAKKHRGRPPGSVKKQLDALGVQGVGFTPHVIMVEAGEDIASKIMAFSQQGPRTVCILSAYGAVCNVTLQQPAISGGTVTYEGRFEIISLSGSFQLSENNGNHSRAGGLRVSLAGSDGRVLGGIVAGMLKAATLVQVVVGSFIADGKKPKYVPSSTTMPPPSNMLNFGALVTGASPPTPGGSSESAEENDDSPPNNGPGRYSNATQSIQNMQMYSMGWPNSIKLHPS